MDMLQLGYLTVIFIIVVGISFLVMRLFAPQKTQVRLEQIASGNAKISAESSTNQWEYSINKIASPFAALSLPKDGWENSALRTRFMHAGYRSKSVPLYYFGAKTLLAVLFPVLFYTYANMISLELDSTSTMFCLLVLAALGYYLPSIVLSRLIFIRQRELFENLPDAIDLMTVCVEAGLGLDAAMSRVGEEMRLKSKSLAEEFHLVNLEMRAGRTREQALQNLALRAGVEDLEGLVTMLVQADRFGTSIGTSLRVHSDMLRTKRRQRAEEAAAKISLKLLFPLIFFIFPSLLLVLLGPAFIQIYRILLPTLAGQ